MKKINRRDFMKTAGSIALIGVAQSNSAFSSPQQASEQRERRVAVFFEPSFPTEDGMSIEKQTLQQATEGWDVLFINVDELKTQLRMSEPDVIVNPYGSAFPKEAFNSLSTYLKAGGNWVNLGGVPFSVPVVRKNGGWRKEVRQTAYHKKLGITQSFPVSTKAITSYQASEAVEGVRDLLNEFTADEIYEFYVRFTVTKDFPTEDGTAGARDAVLRPLVFGIAGDKQRIAAPFIQIDRLQGDYAGGRWMLANFRGSISAKAIRTLVERALQGAIEFTARPSFACYREGELPSFTIQIKRPKGKVEKLMKGDCRIEILDEKGRSLDRLKVKLHGEGTAATGYADMSLKKRDALAPGLYQVKARMELHSLASDTTYMISHTTGFWSFDKKLLEGGKPFTTNENYLLRDGQPYPVTGTTYMASDVHRKFLFEPNPYLWNRDFSEMKAAGVNMVRTGIWTGWKNYMLDVGAPNEIALRALDAFILTARKYDIPVIFTFFAFLPEQWGGVNAYLDPRSVNAQKEFITAFAHRYRAVNDMIWDLINEPSFCSPHHLWSCRPNYDRFEVEAWRNWLKERYHRESDEEHIARLQEQYRVPADEAVSLPALEEFADVNIFTERRPIKVIDYRLFAQDMFINWVKEMTAAIRSNGNPHQLITVGQDEGGTSDGPNPQFFSEAVDFTCIHNWWLNDDLVWDNVITKTPRKPNLVEETGVMFYEKMDGSAWRTEEDARNLLERKMAISLGVGGAGFIQWIWNTNPFMKLDNEAAIGLFRVDGTAKPELESFIAFSKFFATNQHLMKGKQDEEVLMVIPHSQMSSTRNLATQATRRCVRVMHYECRTPVSAISEYRLDTLNVSPTLLVVPSPRTINEKAWETLLEWAQRGTTLLVTGIIDTDDHWLPVPRTKQLGIEAFVRPVAQEEFLSIDGVQYQLSYRGEKIQRIEKAVMEQGGLSKVATIPHGKGNIVWSPLPVEISDSVEPTVALYNYALKVAGLAPIFSVEHKDSSVLIQPTLFAEAVLYAFVSECDRETDINLTHLETKTAIHVKVPPQRAAMIFLSRKDGRVLSQLG